MTSPLTAEVRAWQALLRAHPELLEDDDLRLDMMEGETRIHEQIAALCRASEVKKAKAVGLAGLVKDMQDRKKHLEAGADKLRTLAFNVMTDLGLPNIPAPDMTISLKLAPVDPLIESPDADPDKLPDALVRIKREPDKKEIRAALERGETVAGYHLGNRSTTLAIRR